MVPPDRPLAVRPQRSSSRRSSLTLNRFLDLFRGQKFLGAVAGGPLHGRIGTEIPHPLQIRLTPFRSGNLVIRLRLSAVQQRDTARRCQCRGQGSLFDNHA